MKRKNAKPTTVRETADMQLRIVNLARQALTGKQCCEVAADLIRLAGIRHETIVAFINRLPDDDAEEFESYFQDLQQEST